jgi:uncharacterized protein
MTDFEIERLPLNSSHLHAWRTLDPRLVNWPVVYVLDDDDRVYVGETGNAAVRMDQHLKSNSARSSLNTVRIVLDDTFNKSACLDLESRLIALFAGEGRYKVLNRNEGIVNSEYYDRAGYRDKFDAVFEELREQKLFTRSIAQIENSELFKLSPFKALNSDQAVAMEGILDGLFEDLESGVSSTIVVQGDPGTGKTIVAVYLAKLLRDIADGADFSDVDGDSLFSDFFVPETRALLREFRIGVVVPQQALRSSLRKVFAKTPNLDRTMVITPFDVGDGDDTYDLLIVDETHRLNQRANQPSGVQNKRFADINTKLFGTDDDDVTQLDWIIARSRHQLFMIDSAQSVRPADLPAHVQGGLVEKAKREDRFYPLFTQMRVQGGRDYVSYVRAVVRGETPSPETFGAYDFRMFGDLGLMHDAIREKDAEFGLARLVAGYAWPWRSKKDHGAVDIELDGRRLQWNRTEKDWINSPGAVDQVGSIHTVQGYDLNYVGVIIGPDLRWDHTTERMVFDRSNYFDRKGMEDNRRRGITYTDDDILTLVENIYAVLLTRGVRGTYLYVCDAALRARFSRFVAWDADLGATSQRDRD